MNCAVEIGDPFSNLADSFAVEKNGSEYIAHVKNQ